MKISTFITISVILAIRKVMFIFKTKSATIINNIIDNNIILINISISNTIPTEINHYTATY